MTPSQARVFFKSLVFRGRMADGLPEIEGDLYTHLEMHGEQIISGYRVWVDSGMIRWQKLKTRAVDLNQLKLPLGWEVHNGITNSLQIDAKPLGSDSSTQGNGGQEANSLKDYERKGGEGRRSD